MTEENKGVTSTPAVEEGKTATPALEGGEKVTQPKENVELQHPFKVFKTQADFDNEAAKIKGSVERSIFKKLGAKEEADLEKYKKAYEDSLTEAEKNAKALEELNSIKQENERKNYVIQALVKEQNKAIEDVEKQVTMAVSLVVSGDYANFGEAFDYVRGLKSTAQPPVGKKIEQPDVKPVEKNPFKKGENFSYSEQTRIFKENPELARKLALEAGLKLL